MTPTGSDSGETITCSWQDVVERYQEALKQAERERDEARAKLEATIDALGLAQRTIAATARTFDRAKVPSDLATIEDTIACTTHNVTTVADRARWLANALRLAQEREAASVSVFREAYNLIAKYERDEVGRCRHCRADRAEGHYERYVGTCEFFSALTEIAGHVSECGKRNDRLDGFGETPSPTVTSEET
jgi:hypothetical protein